MKIKASARYLRGSPRKVRGVARLVVGMSPLQAIDKLKLVGQKPSAAIIKVIQQAVANAKNNFKIEKPQDLRISQIKVNEGPRIKRIDKSHGARFDRGIIQKKFYHLELTLEGEKKDGK
jgi:large subunit ribosomal protein L22